MTRMNEFNPVNVDRVVETGEYETNSDRIGDQFIRSPPLSFSH